MDDFVLWPRLSLPRWILPLLLGVPVLVLAIIVKLDRPLDCYGSEPTRAVDPWRLVEKAVGYRSPPHGSRLSHRSPVAIEQSRAS